MSESVRDTGSGTEKNPVNPPDEQEEELEAAGMRPSEKFDLLPRDRAGGASDTRRGLSR